MTHFIFGFPVFVAIVFGYVLASTSPAVTVPTMIQLQEKGLGTYKGIPTIILASASIDNLYCITAFYFMADMVFMEHDLYTFVSIPIELVFAILIGILIGLLLRVLPRSDSQKTSLHFIRGSLILSISLALYFGSKSIKCDIAGPVSILCMCAVASMSWKRDNSKKTMPEEKCLRILWVLVFQPFLFALIGLVFDISKIELNRIVIAIEILVIGVLFRIIVVFILSFVGKFNFKERCYISIAFLPKATVQAALVPVIYNYCSNDYTCRPFAQDILQTCILSIIITAPVGQILLQVLSKCLLSRESEGSLSTVKIKNGDQILIK
uniref:Cation/H+ exchanger domain-containing protein n=1 Tax=Acrobeloides nanus TaxID=290746 RepID=A0A914CKJ7_9BILA